MPQVTAKVTAILQNPDGVWEEEIPVELPSPELATAAMLRITGGFAAQGGLVRISSDGLNFIPMNRVRSMDIKISTLELAAPGDIGAAAARARAIQKVGGKIHLG